MGRSTKVHPALHAALRVLRAVANGLARALQLLFAVVASTSDKANAPLLPPDTKPWYRREDYRP